MQCKDCECEGNIKIIDPLCFCELPTIDHFRRVEEFLERHSELYEEFQDKSNFFLHPCRLHDSLHLFPGVLTTNTPEEEDSKTAALSCITSDATGEYSLVKLEIHGQPIILIQDCLCHLEDMLKRNIHVQHLVVSGSASHTLPALLGLIHLPRLRYLDASHNNLHELMTFEIAPEFLSWLCYAHNAVTCIRDLTAFWSLVVLDLSHNKIKMITGLQGLRYLKRVDLSYNQIECVDGLDGLPISWLDLSYNRVSCGRLTLLHLRTLKLRHNLLDSLRLLEECPSLRTVCIRDNAVNCIGNTKELWWLHSLDLRGNSICLCPTYRELVLLAMPALQVLDGKDIYPEEYVTLMLETHPTERVRCTRKLLALHASFLRVPAQDERNECENDLLDDPAENPEHAPFSHTIHCLCSVKKESAYDVPECFLHYEQPVGALPLHVQYADHMIIRGRLYDIQKDIAPCRAFR